MGTEKSGSDKGGNCGSRGAAPHKHTHQKTHADERRSFCCDEYALTRHDLRWQRPESRQFSVAEPHEPDYCKGA